MNKVEDIEDLRPHNHGQLPEFNYLVRELFVPLNKISHDKTNRTSKTFAKEQVIKRFISLWRQHVGDDIYPAVISILAQRDRTMYNMKEDRFISILSKVAHIKKGSDDWNSLKQWKRRSQNRVQAERSFEDIAASIVMVKGICCPEGAGKLLLSDFNEYLQKLATLPDREKVPLIKELCGKLSYDEVRFFFRILMKRNPMGGMEKSFLYNWNPDMLKLINLTNNLKYAFWKLAEKDKRLPDYEKIVQLMKPFTPQRSERIRKTYDEIAALFQNEFFIEEKYDGERFQLHMERQSDNTIAYKYFTRNANEFSFLYGETSTSAGCISPFITNSFKPGLKSCVLDGEMISYDPIRKRTLPFSTVKSAALDMLAQQKTEIETSECYPMFVVFDILYCNGYSVENKPLSDRKKLLRGIIPNPVSTRFEVAGFKRCTSGKEVEEALSEAIRMDSEGIMVKDPKSKYHVGTVSKDWVKVKPEYLEEFGENLDLIIVGKTPAIKTTYICALRNYVNPGKVVSEGEDNDTAKDPTDDEEEEDDGKLESLLTDDDCRFITLCKVANGFSHDDYKRIEANTVGKWRSVSKLPSEDLIKFGTALPESWIDPRDSVVIEVKSRSVDPETKIDQFGVGTTLFNAYCVKLREDKDWKVASTLAEFDEKSAYHKHKVAPHTVTGVKRKKLRLTQKEYYQERLNSNIPFTTTIASLLFDHLTFYVLSDYVDHHKRYSKSDLMRILKNHGGNITATAKVSDVDRRNLVILSQKTTREVIELANKGCDILSFSWIFDCIKVNQRIPVEPSHCLNVSDLRRVMASFAVDKYGDSFTMPVTNESLNRMIERMPAVPEASAEDNLEFRPLLFKLFEDLKFLIIHIDKDPEHLLSTRIQLYSGSLTDSIGNCSFVVVCHYENPEDNLQISPQVEYLRDKVSHFKSKIPRFVTPAFVEKSIEEGVLVDAVSFKVI